MKVSFVVPIYKKKAEQVKKALKSLQEQSHKNIEVIGVFDGPDAELEAAFTAFEKDERFRHIVIEHGGAPKARNAGARIATGDVVSFWDADCYAEPEMTAVWVDTFKDNPSCDFVYSGYKWENPGVPGFESEPFDPWLITKYNFLSSMFPLKREKVVEWDESLDGLQDWDYWRRVVANGSKGRFIPGFGFSTDLPDDKSISGGDPEKRKARIEKVRQKHEDVNTPIIVHGMIYKRETVHIAKLLGADYFWNPWWRIRDYRLALMVGFHPWELREAGTFFRDAKSGTVRAIYWKGLDAEMLYNAPYQEAKALAKGIVESIAINLCGEKRTQDILEDMGIRSELVPLPREAGEPVAHLPPYFRVLVLHDDAFGPLLQSVIKAMPDIKFDVVQPEKVFNTLDYTVHLHFTKNPRLLEETKKFLLEGRYLISNVQEPYAGYLEVGEDVTKFKEKIIATIRDLQNVKEINKKAQNYYLEQTSPEKFKEKILSYLPKMEVVS